MTLSRLLLLAGMLLLGCGSAESTTIYSNFGVPGPDGTGGGYLLGIGHPPYPFSGSYGIAVPFVPSGDYALDSIRIPVTIFTSYPNNQLTVELRSGATTPSAVLESYPVAVSGFSVLDLSSSMHPVLSAGTKYWVTAIMDSAGGAWGWGGLDHPLGEVALRSTASAEWSMLAFNLPGLEVSGTAVPEPSTSIAILGLAGIGLLSLRRRLV